MPPGSEVLGNGAIRGQEALGLVGRFAPLHAPLALARRPVRDLTMVNRMTMPTALLDDVPGPGGAQRRTRLRNPSTTGHERNLPMPTFHIPPHLDMHYEVDDYTDPWRPPATVLMLHGNAESGVAWYGWVPHLAPWYRVVRPDMRGFGASTPMPRDFPWTLDILIDDFCRLIDALGVERFHLVGAKIGGTIARAFAARRPARVRTLTVVGTPPPYRLGAEARAPA